MSIQRRASRNGVRALLIAAVTMPACLLLADSAALGQYQVQNGNARDANPRVGSAGRNDSQSRYGTTVNPNNVVYGNITGGKYFRGPVGAPDPRAFRGDTAGTVSDAFIRDSAGGYDQAQFTGSFNAQPYYGASRAVGAPVQYTPAVGGLSSGMGSQSSTYYNNRLSPSEILARDARVQGDTLVTPRAGTGQTATTIISGPLLDANGQPGSYLLMSPLSGARQLSPGELEGSFVIRGSERIPVAPGTPGSQQIQPGLIDQIRNELNGQNAPGAATPANGLGQPLNAQVGGGNTAGAAAGNAAAAPGGALANQQIGQPLTGSTDTGQGVRRQFATPAQQSSQYRELQRRWAANNRPMTDDEAERRFREEQALRNRVNANNPAIPGATTKPVAPAIPGGVGITPGITPGGISPVIPGGPAGSTPSKPEPLMIKSLATGVASPTLAGVLTKAEDLLRVGKFNDAVNEYEKAAVATPNNPLIVLGRAHAHLAAGSYRTAALDIRRAVAADQALLAGKYDLKAILPADRLAHLQKDLTDLAGKEPTEPTAPFLLAYLSYNTDNEAKTSGYLAEVDRRQPQPDPIVRLMRSGWTLPAAADQNK